MLKLVLFMRYLSNLSESNVLEPLCNEESRNETDGDRTFHSEVSGHLYSNTYINVEEQLCTP